MRTLLPSRLLRSNHAAVLTVSSPAAAVQASVTSAPPVQSAPARCDPQACLRNCRCFAHVKDIDQLNRDVWFTSSVPRLNEITPPDERTLQLGRTVRTLHERLPTLLLSPLPSEILSPQITLHLFPSTHPHLPTVSGRIGYVAALWTAPVAWGRIPLVGNVKLDITSERMVRNGGSSTPVAMREEKLIVKWKTCGNKKARNGDGSDVGTKDPVDKLKEFISGAGEISFSKKPSSGEEFCGIFIFEFDEQGRIVKHTIEHTEEDGRFDHMTRVVSVTDWLLGQFNGKKKEQIPELALCEDRPTGRRIHLMDSGRQLD